MFASVMMYALAGIMAGILAGLLGLGGGVVIIPLLHFAFEIHTFDPAVSHKLILGTSLASIVFTSLSSARAHHSHGAVIWDIVKKMTPGILLGTFFGAFLASILPSHYLQIIFVIFLCYVIYSMLADIKPKPTRTLPGTLALCAVGIFSGAFSSLVGIAGGIIAVTYLVWNNIDMRKAVGTSAALGFPVALGGCIGYIVNGFNAVGLPEYSIGFVYLPALVPLVILSTIIAPIAARTAHRLPVKTLKKCFALLLIFVAIKMFNTALTAF